MRWTKIKNIVILLLVIVNLFLLGLVGARAWRTAENERLARERMLTVLEQNGITFLPGELPDRMALEPLRVTAGPGGEAPPVPEGVALRTVRGGHTVDMDREELVGTWESPAPAGEAITASTALMRFLEELDRGGYVCSQITDLYAGYTVSGSGTLTLSPTWYVETDSYRFAVDAYTGTVTAQE